MRYRVPEVRLANQLTRILLPLLLIIFQQVRQLDFVPALTLAALGINILTFLSTAGGSVLPMCLSAHKVLRGDYSVLLHNTFVHADGPHLYYNCLSFLHKSLQLERALGMARYGVLLLQCCALTPLLYVALELAGAALAPQHFSRRDCAVGFSGVIFALKVICQHHFPSHGAVMGIPLPPALLAWGELLAISLLSPNASFVGHLAGILAGLAIVHGEPALGRMGGGRAGRRVVGGRLY